MGPEDLKLLVSAIDRLSRVSEELARSVVQLKLRNSPPVQLVSPASLASMLDCSVSAILKQTKKGKLPLPEQKLFEGSRGLRWTMDQVKDILVIHSTSRKAEDDSPAPPYVSIRKHRRSQTVRRKLAV